jgi:hypothetical protein
MTISKLSPSAVDEYLRLHLELIAKADILRGAIEDHQDGINPEKLSWGHVGDLEYALGCVNAAIEALNH